MTDFTRDLFGIVTTPPNTARTLDPTVNHFDEFGWKHDSFLPCQRPPFRLKNSCANKFTLDCLLMEVAGAPMRVVKRVVNFPRGFFSETFNVRSGGTERRRARSD